MMMCDWSIFKKLKVLDITSQQQLNQYQKATFPSSIQSLYFPYSNNNANIFGGAHNDETEILQRLKEANPNACAINKDLFWNLFDINSTNDTQLIEIIEENARFITCPNITLETNGIGLLHQAIISTRSKEVILSLINNFNLNINLPVLFKKSKRVYLSLQGYQVGDGNEIDESENPIEIPYYELIDPFKPVYPLPVCPTLNNMGTNPIDLIMYSGFTPLHIATNLIDVEIIQLLIENGANVDSVCISSGLFAGATPLMFASYMQNTYLIDILVNANANPKLTTKNGWNSILFSALTINEQTIPCIKKLISLGCPLSNVSNDGFSFFSFAISSGNQEILEEIMKLGFNPPQSHLNDLFYQSTNNEANQPWVINFLLENFPIISKGISKEIKNDRETTILQSLLISGLDGIGKLLSLDHVREKINQKDQMGFTALNYAILNQNENENYLRTIQQLISNGADPTIENNEGQNSLFLFISSSTDRLVAVLPVGPVGFGSLAIGQDIEKTTKFHKR